jgi:hypothetical protein
LCWKRRINSVFPIHDENFFNVSRTVYRYLPISYPKLARNTRCCQTLSLSGLKMSPQHRQETFSNMDIFFSHIVYEYVQMERIIFVYSLFKVDSSITVCSSGKQKCTSYFKDQNVGIPFYSGDFSLR